MGPDGDTDEDNDEDTIRPHASCQIINEIVSRSLVVPSVEVVFS